jgi:hypothetical protein
MISTGVKMNKKLFLCWTIIVVFCAGCSTTAQKTPETISATPTQPIMLGGPVTQWELVDLPILTTEDYSLAVYALRLTGQDTIILCSITGAGSDKFAELSAIVHLQDNAGRISSIVSAGTFATLDATEFGFLKFSPRPVGASELILQVSQGTGFVDLPIAFFASPPEDISVYHIRTYLLGSNQVVEQNGFRLTFRSWSAPAPGNVTLTPVVELPASTSTSGEAEAGALSTATPYHPQPIIPREGVTVTNEATLQIEDDNGDIYYLYMQFLSDGEVIGELFKKD